MNTAYDTIRKYAIASFDQFHRIEELILDAMKEYGRDCAKQALKDAADNATLEPNGMLLKVDKQSILDTEIKTP